MYFIRRLLPLAKIIAITQQLIMTPAWTSMQRKLPIEKRDNDEISTAPSASSNNNNNNSDDEAIILELATAVDAYGTGSDIIGRRSFGGFHKSVRTTWDAALKQSTDDAAGKKIPRCMLRTRSC